MTRKQAIYFEKLIHEHRIGFYCDSGYYFSDSNSDYWSSSIMGYYEFIEPNIVYCNFDVSCIFRLSLFSSTLLDVIKGHPTEEAVNLAYNDLIGNKKIYMFKYFEWNENYKKYRKIWRKYKNKWFKKISYKSIEKQIYYDWQYYDEWYFSKKDFEKLKEINGEEEFQGQFLNPNIIGFHFDGEEIQGINYERYSDEMQKYIKSLRKKDKDKKFVEYKGKMVEFVKISAL